ncbi:MAG: malto-oligosyltrehalose trehalohydrolase, partial [Thermodesulfobacteriota bacterium]|nr:malto-oligosyltrehalose trehalohydrolase [Thermodesulfobacteriota bacterium]
MTHIGALYCGAERCLFSLWAPFLRNVTLRIVSPRESFIPMKMTTRGYWHAIVEDITPDTCYLYHLEGNRDRPDPASHFQPEGVHGLSQVINHQAFFWDDEDWRGIPLEDMVIYELHTGTFTPEGTFGAIIPRLEELSSLGVNAIELMPVAQFPGERNWGYDGVYLFAVQNSYGGPFGLKRLVNECHKRNIAVILDVVYNHFGPEGNYLWDFGPYFTDKYQTPWGTAINFDDAYCDEVRNFFLENALFWFKHYHIDALRLDAIHGIYDMSARPFLQELVERVDECSLEFGRRLYVIAESDLNDSRIITPIPQGGYGIDAQWCDDFHHSVHSILTGEEQGYYGDFGTIDHLIKSIKEGFVYSGQYSRYRKRRHGNSSKERAAHQFVIFSQNHDQVGNRIAGERLSNLVSFDMLKLTAGIMLLAPSIPLLFMGEEYGEDNPFLYFVSHTDHSLIEAVRRGRKEEFSAFKWRGEPPDPQCVETFLKSKLSWAKRDQGHYHVLLNFYKTLITLRKETPALSNLERSNLAVWGCERKKVVFMKRGSEDDGYSVLCIFNFNKTDTKINTSSLPEGKWEMIFDSSEMRWHGSGTLLFAWFTTGEEISLRRESF